MGIAAFCKSYAFLVSTELTDNSDLAIAAP